MPTDDRGRTARKEEPQISHFMISQTASLLFDLTGALIAQIRRFDSAYQVIFPVNRSASEPLDPATLSVPV